jgi:hypothetical protein
MEGFESSDAIKRKNITGKQLMMLEISQKITKPFRPLLALLRDYFDSQIMKQIRKDAEETQKNARYFD